MSHLCSLRELVNDLNQFLNGPVHFKSKRSLNCQRVIFNRLFLRDTARLTMADQKVWTDEHKIRETKKITLSLENVAEIKNLKRKISTKNVRMFSLRGLRIFSGFIRILLFYSFHPNLNFDRKN